MDSLTRFGAVRNALAPENHKGQALVPPLSTAPCQLAVALIEAVVDLEFDFEAPRTEWPAEVVCLFRVEPVYSLSSNVIVMPPRARSRIRGRA